MSEQSQLIFKKNLIYRHITSKDLDIKVINVTHLNDRRVKLKIKWINQTNGNFIYLQDGSLTDTIEIDISDFKYWKQVQDRHANTTL